MNKVVRDMIMRRRRDSAYDGNYDRRNYDRNYTRAGGSMDGTYHSMDGAYDMGYDQGYKMGYDRAYDRAYEDARYDRGQFNMLTPYGERGMTVSGVPRDEMYDGKQGVKGTGRYGIGGSRYYGRRDYADDKELYLTEEDMRKWKQSLMNADGTRGEHFQMPQIEQAMNMMNIVPKDYTPEELCLTANVMYSDYCDTFKNIIPKEKEYMYYTKMAKDFLDDKDASVRGSEKLATYYYCIVDGE